MEPRPERILRRRRQPGAVRIGTRRAPAEAGGRGRQSYVECDQAWQPLRPLKGAETPSEPIPNSRCRIVARTTKNCGVPVKRSLTMIAPGRAARVRPLQREEFSAVASRPA